VDVGVYRCSVQNSFGSSSDLIRIVRVTNHIRNPGKEHNPPVNELLTLIDPF